MIEQNHECYVSLEVAKLLKESGFDWKCNGTFISEDGIQYAFIKMDAAYDSNNSKYNPYNISAPTLEVAQRWLRERKKIFLYTNGIGPYTTFLDSFAAGEVHFIDYFDTCESALETGIKKALEIILEKGE